MQNYGLGFPDVKRLRIIAEYQRTYPCIETVLLLPIGSTCAPCQYGGDIHLAYTSRRIGDTSHETKLNLVEVSLLHCKLAYQRCPRGVHPKSTRPVYTTYESACCARHHLQEFLLLCRLLTVDETTERGDQRSAVVAACLAARVKLCACCSSLTPAGGANRTREESIYPVPEPIARGKRAYIPGAEERWKRRPSKGIHLVSVRDQRADDAASSRREIQARNTRTIPTWCTADE
eukprot:1188050-Prorocentrum_minimum.AAC.2